ncbi:putative ABC transporter [Xylaria palmicola]|nr:putative ABC transporter [Xylaria palmicola]
MAPEPVLVLHIASTACAAVFLLSRYNRLWTLRRYLVKNNTGWRGALKVASIALLPVLLASYWPGWFALEIPYKTSFSISLLASVLAALGLSPLLFHEEQQPRNSQPAVVYLFASILCDTVYLIMHCSRRAQGNAVGHVALRCCVHLVLLVLQYGVYGPALGRHKRRSSGQRHGAFDNVLFTWIGPAVLQGHRPIVGDQELPPLSREMKPELTRKAMLRAWSQRAKPETERTLLLVLTRCLQAYVFAPVIPRLFLILFRYSQPTLIKESIRYVATYVPEGGIGDRYWLTLSAVIVYFGLALSTALYQHGIDRLKMMTKSALLGLIHDKTMKSPSMACDNGKVITLISTDVENLDGFAEMMHETWAQLVEVLIGIALLAREVGWIWPLPLFLIFLCSRMSRYVAKHLQPRQQAWNDATQNRIAATSSVLGAIKNIKMLGLQGSVTRRILDLRRQELWTASRLRWIIVYNNASANALGIFSPAITMVFLAMISKAQGRDLHKGTAFTTTAILAMVTHPANMVMTIVPRIVAALAAFQRIQTFLLQPALKANREIMASTAANHLSRHPTSGGPTKPGLAIHIQNVLIRQEQLSLEDINLRVSAGSFTIISGPTGSGKSTLMRAMLGEVVPVCGSISLSTRRVAYCSQRPWLPSDTIRGVVCGAADKYEETWYHEVINACCLAYDFDSLPHGDETRVGNRGLNLSGGQRQRVALARALYARCDILLLDDTFSGLDGETERTIFESLFTASGLTRQLKTSAVLISNSSQYFQFANHIVVLGDRGIVDQGPWQDIKVKAASIDKLSAGQRVEDTTRSADVDKIAARILAKDETYVDLARQTGDTSLYSYYFGFTGLANLLLLLTTTALYAFFITIPQYWLRLWTEVGGRNNTFYIGGFLLLSFMSWAATSTQMWSIVIRLAPHSGSRIHKRLLQIIMSAPLSYFSRTADGSILNRFSQDIQIIDKQLPSALQTLVTQILKLLVQVIVLCKAQKWLALSLPACAILVYWVQKVYLRISRPLQYLKLQSQAGMFSGFLETIDGLDIIRAFGWSRAATQDNIRCIDNSQRPEYLLLALQLWLKIVLDIFAAIVSSSVVAIAVMLRGTISGAQVGIALNIMLSANATLLKLVASWTTLETSLGAISRLKSLETLTPSEVDNSPGLEPPGDWPSKGHVEFRNVTASYQSESTALRDVSLSIAAGQKLVVCGRTGSGKSTLILCLLRLLELGSGKIEVDGLDIKQVSLDLLRRRCFVTVTQDALILSNETLRFNLDPEVSLSDEAIIDILVKARLWPHFEALEGKLREERATAPAMATSSRAHLILDQKISLFQELSMGQCQLFALCRALVKVASLRRFGSNPVILLDEITSSLDVATESIIYRIVDDEFTKRGHTVIIVTHRLDALKEHIIAGRDAIALLADGHLTGVMKDL